MVLCRAQHQCCTASALVQYSQCSTAIAHQVLRCPSASLGMRGASGMLRLPPALTTASPWYQALRGAQRNGFSPPE